MQVPQPKKAIVSDVTRVPGVFHILVPCLIPALCRKNLSCVCQEGDKPKMPSVSVERERGDWSALPSMGNPSEWDGVKYRNRVLYLLAGDGALLEY